MQEGSLFRDIEATERELYWAGILHEESGGSSGALCNSHVGHDACFDGIEPSNISSPVDLRVPLHHRRPAPDYRPVGFSSTATANTARERGIGA